MTATPLNDTTVWFEPSAPCEARGRTTTIPPGERADLLAQALHRLGLSAGAEIAILVCPAEGADEAVAAEAIRKLGGRAVTLDVTTPVVELAGTLREWRPALLVACAHGVEAWRATSVPLRVIGDGSGPGVLWWRVLELRERATRRQEAKACGSAEADVPPPGGGGR